MKHTRWFCIVLAALMALSLAACGKDKPESPETKTVTLEVGDYELLYKDAYLTKDYAGDDAIVLTLDFTNNDDTSVAYLWAIIEYASQNGEDLEFATVYISDESDQMVSDTQMTEVAPGETLEIQTAFVLADTTSEVEIIFEELSGDKSDNLTIDPSNLSQTAPEKGDVTPSSGGGEGLTDGNGSAALTEWWNGDWYGWWIMTGCYGYYEDMEGDWWDICGTIDIGEDGVGTVTLWDEDYTESEPMASAAVSLSEAGTGEFGTLMSEGGRFTDIDLEHADWIVDPGLLDYPDMIHISGYYESGEDEYTYDIYLRPWGTYWDDVTEEDLPYYYYDWYLPLIESGESMPDSIG